MKALKLPHTWSMNALLIKAQRYASIMLEKERTDWQFGFWSVLSLEILARAALAKISPTLLAQSTNWNNIYYALGHSPTASGFVPRSINIAEVFKRLEAILPEFSPEIHNFCSSHINHRNTELHSGELAFDGIGTSTWLPKYYLACQILLKSLGKGLIFLLGIEEAGIAKTLIQSLEDKTKRDVFKIIKEHKLRWESWTVKERSLKAKQSEALASRHEGHRVKCPSCRNTALLHGKPIGPPKNEINEVEIIERQSMLPSHLECVACELKITGFSKLDACGLGDAFTSTSYYDAVDYFDIDHSPEMYYEED